MWTTTAGHDQSQILMNLFQMKGIYEIRLSWKFQHKLITRGNKTSRVRYDPPKVKYNFKYTSNILEVYFQSMFKYKSIPQIYFKYTSTCQITEEEVYFKSMLFRQKKYIRSKFCKIKSVFQCKLEVYFKYTLSILKVYFLKVYYKHPSIVL